MKGTITTVKAGDRIGKMIWQGRHAVNGVIQFLFRQEWPWRLERATEIESLWKQNQDKDVK